MKRSPPEDRYLDPAALLEPAVRRANAIVLLAADAGRALDHFSDSLSAVHRGDFTGARWESHLLKISSGDAVQEWQESCMPIRLLPILQ